MKFSQTTRFRRDRLAFKSRKQGGFVATVLFIALLTIMMLATAGGMAIIHLHREVKVLEREQIKRLNLSATNSVSIAHVNVVEVNSK